MKSYKLLNGKLIPEIGYGTWLSKGDDAYKGTLLAIEAGYTHIDSASAYENEEEVGRAIRDSKVDRSKLFVTTKVPAEIKNYDDAKRIIETSLNKLNIGYIDLLLIHCPTPWSEYDHPIHRYEKENLEVWKAMSEAYIEGKVKSIGVSNFNIDDIKNINSNSDVPVMVNQIQTNIGYTPLELIKYCQDNGIVVEAYCPNAHGKLMENGTIKKYADKYGVSNAQFCIKYTLMLGTVSLPKSLNKEHIEEDLKMDFEIDSNDFEVLKTLKP